jgi:hypothetical protein
VALSTAKCSSSTAREAGRRKGRESDVRGCQGSVR